MGYVGQEPVLFDMSLRENVLYGVAAKNLSLEKERELLEDLRVKANLDFVKSDSDWELVVGPRGGRLSGGQKQRVAIARAIAKDPDIFLFDEATSALDTVSESLIQNAVNSLVTKTVVVIAHRLSTVVNSDIILVMETGKIVEHGSHEFLINRNSLYTHLYRSGN
jgi:ABC-type multidrug transport system fused ATPase/permease subunit